MSVFLIRKLISEISKALRVLFKNKIFYGKVKPSNIILLEDKFCLADFCSDYGIFLFKGKKKQNKMMMICDASEGRCGIGNGMNFRPE